MAPLAVAIGGALGALSRWSLNQLILTRWVNKYPAGTLAVNLLGCLLFGIVYGYLSRRIGLRSDIGLFLLTGFLGSFTTFSTYASDTVRLAQDNGFGAAAVNIAVHTVMGILLILTGLWLAARG